MAGLWPAGWAPRTERSHASPAPLADAAPLILTLALPDALQRRADDIRRDRLPDAAARAPAHLALFRHLPGLQQASLVHTLRALVAGPAPLLEIGDAARWNGRWVAPVQAPAQDRLRAELAARWHGLLAPGDLAPPRLHISLAEGRAAPPPLPPGPWRARGLLLWRHGHGGTERDGAFWTPLVAVAFRG
jgi:hypothetical protein